MLLDIAFIYWLIYEICLYWSFEYKEISHLGALKRVREFIN